MDNKEINQALLSGNFAASGVLPRIDNLKTIEFVFKQDFGLKELPIAPGIILIRGARQYGKSTWLEQQIAQTIKKFGPGTALYLNGDEIKDSQALIQEIRILIQLFTTQAKVKRLFIDEITAIDNWQKELKRLIDRGELKDILLVTTGSKAKDLRMGVERLPGRKGQLDRTNFIFTPLSYKEFKSKCGAVFKDDTLYAYILSGGSPVGANALAAKGFLPEYVISIITDWIFGEFAANGRSRSSLLAILQSLYKMGGTPIGQAKLARESGLANNTVAHNHIELLSDLMVVMPAFPYDPSKQISIYRKPCKYHFINTLAAICWHPKRPRTIEDLKQLDKQEFGVILEWVVAQEIWRTSCINNSEDMPLHLNFWQSKDHEIDFVIPKQSQYLEVKSGTVSPINCSWFLKNFNKDKLIVINQKKFSTDRIIGVTLEDYLINGC